MAKHFVMDHTGHSTIEFDPKNEAASREAMERFEALVGDQKFIAATRKAGEKDYKVVKTFAETEDETLFKPHNVGG